MDGERFTVNRENLIKAHARCSSKYGKIDDDYSNASSIKDK